jgi:hypothetical protein
VSVNRISRSVAAALAVSAIVAPTASARPIGDRHPVDVEAPAPSVVVTTTERGFDWGSAGLGAGVAGAMVLLSYAGARVRVRAIKPLG